MSNRAARIPKYKMPSFGDNANENITEHNSK